MQIENTMINDRLRVSKFYVSWKFCFAITYNFAAIYPWNLLLFKKVPYFWAVSIVFSIYKQNLTDECENLSVCYLSWNSHYLLLYCLHDCTFNRLYLFMLSSHTAILLKISIVSSMYNKNIKSTNKLNEVELILYFLLNLLITLWQFQRYITMKWRILVQFNPLNEII